MTDADSIHNVLCFGEVLWDRLPDGDVPGGAPMNVAYHLTKLGCTAWLLSSVGDDRLGKELMWQLRDWQVRCDYVNVDRVRPTGTVSVAIENGSPTYDIANDVAWDRIVVPGDLAAVAPTAAAVVYGSLAQRQPYNRSSLLHILEQTPTALKVFDVNLRSPYDDHEVIWQLARRADLIKLNDEEIGVLLNASYGASELEQRARELAGLTECDRVCITAGAEGAGLLDKGTWHWATSEEVIVADTIGAGDAFLAALVAGLVRQSADPGPILARASHLAGFVASQKGATPNYNVCE